MIEDNPISEPQAQPRGLFERDWQRGLVVLLTILAGLGLLWVLWQVLSPILHTLVLFGLAAVVAFALDGPVSMLAKQLRGNRIMAIVLVYALVGIVVVGGLILLAGPFVRQASDLATAL